MPCGVKSGDCAFEQAHNDWITGDLVGFLAKFSEDIVWIVNMDGVGVPYVSSAVGKEDLRWRLQHLMETFDIAQFSIDVIEHGPDVCRSVISIVYVHRSTGEPLDVKLRFTGRQRDGIIVSMEESSDAAYVVAYNRFVEFLEATRDPRCG
ncbi:MAG: nuclear transport factor 2 family protein [Hyphomicrobiaceae bacterium]